MYENRYTSIACIINCNCDIYIFYLLCNTGLNTWGETIANSPHPVPTSVRQPALIASEAWLDWAGCVTYTHIHFLISIFTVKSGN